MEIDKTEKGARLRLTNFEAAEAGLTFDTFGKGDPATEAFLIAALALLKEQGLVSSRTEQLDIAVSEDDSGLVLNISERRRQGSFGAVLFSDPAEFEERLHELCREGEPRGELYKCDGGYALVADGQPPDPEQNILAAKIREYGKLLSDSPFELI